MHPEEYENTHTNPEKYMNLSNLVFICSVLPSSALSCHFSIHNPYLEFTNFSLPGISQLLVNLSYPSTSFSLFGHMQGWSGGRSRKPVLICRILSESLPKKLRFFILQNPHSICLWYLVFFIVSMDYHQLYIIEILTLLYFFFFLPWFCLSFLLFPVLIYCCQNTGYECLHTLFFWTKLWSNELKNTFTLFSKYKRWFHSYDYWLHTQTHILTYIHIYLVPNFSLGLLI